MKNVERSAVISKVIEIIGQRGWWQSRDTYVEQTKSGKPGRVSVNYAVRQAVAELSGSDYDMWEARYAIMAVNGGYPIESWNDNPKTTRKDIDRVLLEAISVERTWDNHMSWAWTSPTSYSPTNNGGTVSPEAFLRPPLEGVERERAEAVVEYQEHLLRIMPLSFPSKSVTEHIAHSLAKNKAFLDGKGVLFMMGDRFQDDN